MQVKITEIIDDKDDNEVFRIDRKTIKRLYNNIKSKEDRIRALEAKVAWLECNQSTDKFVVYG